MPTKFKFRLESLRRIRQREEDARKLALAKVQGRLNEQTERAGRYDRMIRQEHQQLRQGGHLVGRLDIRRLAHHRRYVNSVMTGLVQTLCERAGTQQEADRARTDLASAVRRRKVMDQLRQRRWAEWRRLADRAERYELDEIGLEQVRRGRGGND